jgi:hypothetical protein
MVVGCWPPEPELSKRIRTLPGDASCEDSAALIQEALSREDVRASPASTAELKAALSETDCEIRVTAVQQWNGRQPWFDSPFIQCG